MRATSALMGILYAAASAVHPLRGSLAHSRLCTPRHRGVLACASQPPVLIRVIGLGGGGSNAINRVVEAVGTDSRGVEFVSCNTDAQALASSLAPRTLQIGSVCTRGLGAGGKPEIGQAAAEESADAIRAVVEGQDMVFVTAGMGGGTGTGAAPVVAQLAREAGALTVGVVTKPFVFEGRRRQQQAERAIAKLQSSVDVLIVVSNERLLQIVPDGMSLADSFLLADEILRQGIVGLTDLITKPGLVNVDFADMRSIMEEAGYALMGVGRGFGETRAEDAAAAAISSPLLEFPMRRARRVVFSVTGGASMSLQHVNAVAEIIGGVTDADANIIFGAAVEEELGDELCVTVVATDFPDQ